MIVIVVFTSCVLYYLARARTITDLEFLVLSAILALILWQYTTKNTMEHFEIKDKILENKKQQCILIDVASFKAFLIHIKDTVFSNEIIQQTNNKISNYVVIVRNKLNNLVKQGRDESNEIENTYPMDVKDHAK